MEINLICLAYANKYPKSDWASGRKWFEWDRIGSWMYSLYDDGSRRYKVALVEDDQGDHYVLWSEEKQLMIAFGYINKFDQPNRSRADWYPHKQALYLRVRIIELHKRNAEPSFEKWLSLAEHDQIWAAYYDNLLFDNLKFKGFPERWAVWEERKKALPFEIPKPLKEDKWPLN